MRRLIKTLLHGGKEFSNQSALACGKIGKIRQLANVKWEMENGREEWREESEEMGISMCIVVEQLDELLG